MAGKQTKFWTEEENQLLKAIFDKKTNIELMQIFNCTTKHITSHLKRLGLSKRVPEPQVGDKIWRLTILEKFQKQEGGSMKTYVITQCECHPEVKLNPIRLTAIVQGTTKSCGCWKNENARQNCIERNSMHGMANTKLHSIWKAMRARCRESAKLNKKNYFDKGITVCAEWDDFKNFYTWALANGYEEGLTIDREKNDLGYSPDNCRWVTMEEQANNKTNNILVNAFNEIKTVAQWSRDTRCKVSSWTLAYRINNGWNHQTAITTPVMNIRNAGEPTTKDEQELYCTKMNGDANYDTVLSIFNETKCMADWHRDSRCVVDYGTLAYRIKHGWDAEKAITIPPVK